MDVQDIQDSSGDRWGQSKITTGSAIAGVIGDFTLTPEFMGFYSDPGIQRELPDWVIIPIAIGTIEYA